MANGLHSTRNLRVSIEFQDGSKYDIQGLHIAVERKRTLNVEPNSANITIYNINESNREKLYERTSARINGGKYMKIKVYYNEALFYSAYVVNTFSTRMVQDGEWKTMLFCGENPLIFSAVAKKDSALAAGTSKEDQLGLVAAMAEIKDGLKQMEVSIKGFVGGDCLHGKSIARAITIEGNIIQNVQKILRDCFPDDKFGIYVEDDGINIIKAGAMLGGKDFTAGEDLIDPPNLTEQGVNVNVLFNPTATLGGRLIVTAENFELSANNANTLQFTRKHLSGSGIYQMLEINDVIDNFSDQLATTSITGRSMTESAYE